MTNKGQNTRSTHDSDQENVEFGDVNIINRRAIAVTIDTIIFLFGLSAIATVLQLDSGPFLLLLAFVQFFYFWAFEGFFGKTVGKYLIRIEVCKEDGSAIDFKDSFTRNILRYIDSVLYYVVGLVIAESSNKKQRLGDRYSHTLVVKRRQ